MSNFSDLQDLALQIPCEYCGAPPSRWCITMPSKSLASYLHSTRRWAIDQAFSLGYCEGYRDAERRFGTQDAS